MKNLAVIVCIIFFVCASMTVTSRSCRMDLIPNGTKNGCLNCHISPSGGGALNSFGQQIELLVAPGSCSQFWGRDLAVKDADGDTFSNGMELQDPGGRWVYGNPQPGIDSLVSLPGDDTSTPGQSVAPLTGMKIILEPVAEGLTAPTVLTHADDSSGRLFIADQSGEIWIVDDGALLPTPFLDVSSKMVTLTPAYDERGLLGMAFHPAYSSNGFFYVYYSAPTSSTGMNHKSILAEYSVSGNPNLADTGSERIILEVQQPESNHNGGQLAFGPDGFMYIALGDGGGAGDIHGTIGNGQDIETLLGKILRLDVDTGTTAGIPADNPFVGIAGRDEIWAYGLRNPWKFSFDRLNGRLFCADVGQNNYEEVDIVEKGLNYGWRIMEGFHCYNPPSGCDQTGLELPVFEYDHTIGVSISGGYVYRGTRYPSLQGKYVFGDWSLPDYTGNGRLMYLNEVATKQFVWYEFVTNGGPGSGFGRYVRGLGEDENGELYVLSTTSVGPIGSTGAVHRIIVPEAQFTFESGADGWQFQGTVSPFDPPLTSVNNGRLGFNAQGSTNCFSYMYSPDVAIQDGDGYRSRWYVSSSVTDSAQSVQFRLRINQVGSFQAWNRIVNSNNDQAPSASEQKRYSLLFRPDVTGTSDDAAVFSFDILSFDIFDDASSWIYLDEMVVDAISLSIGAAVETYEFASGSEGWQFAGTVASYDMPLTSASDGRLGLQPNGSTNCFSYWFSPDSTVVDSKLYRAKFDLSSSVISADKAVQARLRVNQRGSWQAWDRIVNSNNDQGPSNSGIKSYDVIFDPNVTGTASDNQVIFSFDILSFDIDDDENSWLYLESITLQEANISL